MSIDRAGGDLVVSTRYLNRLLEHEAGDLTATVEAGMRLSALNERLAVHGQMLALDPPGDPTVGGAIAGDLFGPRAHRYGRARDLVLGVTVVLADGTVANAGGKVVKNVAGYDLAKLFCGSHGRLGLIGRASLRLHPRPESSRTLAIPVAAPDEVQGLVRALLHSTLAPSAVDLVWGEGESVLALLFEGGEAAAAAQLARGRALLGGGEDRGFGTRSPPAPVGLPFARSIPRSRACGPRWESCPRPSFGSAPPASRTSPSPTSSRGRRSPSA